MTRQDTGASTADAAASPSRRDSDDLARFVGRALGGDPAHVAWDDARFVEWWNAHSPGVLDPRVPSIAAPSSAVLAAGDALRARVQALRAQDAAAQTGDCATLRDVGENVVRQFDVRQFDVRQFDVRQFDEPADRFPALAPGLSSRTLREASAARAAPEIDLAVAAGHGRALWSEPVDTWVRLPQGVSPGAHLAMRLAGESMSPLLRPGDLLLVRIGAPAHVGAVVVARHTDDDGSDASYVCKRVRRVNSDIVALESIAPDGPSFILPRDADLIVGVVVGVWRG